MPDRLGPESIPLSPAADSGVCRNLRIQGCIPSDIWVRCVSVKRHTLVTSLDHCFIFSQCLRYRGKIVTSEEVAGHG